MAIRLRPLSIDSSLFTMPKISAGRSGLRVYLVTDLLGTDGAGGAARASWLLAERLNHAGCAVTVFAPFGLTVESRKLLRSIPVVSAILQRGCRWGWPTWALIRRIVAHDRRCPADLVVVVGMTRLTAQLLGTRLARRTLVWETTMANPGNPFVDSRSIARLPRALGVLSPSAAIDRNIRSTYQYTTEPLRLPFWVEDARLGLGGATQQQERIDFLFIGRKDPDKGIKALLEAFATVQKERPESRLVICGPGTDGPFQAMARTLGIQETVRFLFLPNAEDLVTLLDQANWVVLPSRHEGYPLVLLDAARCGKPFIATRVGSIPELFGDTLAAILVLPDDCAGLAFALRTALSEPPEQYARRCEAARETFQRLSSNEVILAWINLVLNTACRRMGRTPLYPDPMSPH